jgi:hypothetical protein
MNSAKHAPAFVAVPRWGELNIPRRLEKIDTPFLPACGCIVNIAVASKPLGLYALPQESNKTYLAVE